MGKKTRIIIACKRRQISEVRTSKRQRQSLMSLERALLHDLIAPAARIPNIVYIPNAAEWPKKANVLLAPGIRLSSNGTSAIINIETRAMILCDAFRRRRQPSAKPIGVEALGVGSLRVLTANHKSWCPVHPGSPHGWVSLSSRDVRDAQRVRQRCDYSITKDYRLRATVAGTLE